MIGALKMNLFNMEEINLQKSVTKEEMQVICKEHNTTIKEVVIYKLNKIITSLQKIRDKISNDEIVTNGDWKKAAEPLTSILNAVSNSWYNY